MPIRLGLTFDDVLLEPRRTAVKRNDASVATRLTKQARLAIPLISAASDTVSDARFAIALGKLGGMAVLHRNVSLEEQVKMVKEVKAAGVIVGAAVGPMDVARAVALASAGADVIFIDCAHAHAPGIIEAAKEMKEKFKSLTPLHSKTRVLPLLGEIGRMGPQLVVGNVATKEGAKDFVGIADALKVGIGGGAICTTRIVSGVGVPQLTAIMDVVSVAKKYGIPVIADGGIRFTGDMVKALAAGASTVMLGQLFAGTLETPGEVITENGKQYKVYRGMGSREALEKRHAMDRYAESKMSTPPSHKATEGHSTTSASGHSSSTEEEKRKKTHVAEGVTGKVPFRGTVAEVVEEYVGSIQAGMGYIGAATIEDMWKQARFIQITNAGLKESHPHSLA
ncbi:MAG: IMP dehydrogenase [bacterium]|nr:IMP dehydrogenase [bacterium]